MKTKYQALILEDDSMIVDQLVSFMAQTNLFEQPFICQNTMQAIITLRQHPVDLLVLDMELPDMSSLELLRLFPNHAPTIAISAHPRYAVDCYDQDINDFMPKPLSYTRFLRGLRRTIFQAGATVSDSALPLLTPTFAQPPAPSVLSPTKSTAASTYVYLKIGRKVERFRLSEILYVEAYAIYSKLITSSGTVVINEQLSRLENQLNLNHFIRVHKSFLVNLDQVTQFTTNTIWLSSYSIPIGGTYKGRVQQRLEQLSIVS